MRLLSFLIAFEVFLLGSPVAAGEITFDRGTESGSAVIVLDGEIRSGDDQKFRDISLKLPKATVFLNSNGGALLPAIEIGKLIRVAGYDTIVLQDDVCASSCALIWLAGVNRQVVERGRVGFHAAYRDNQGRLEEVGAANALIGNYLTSLGLPTRAILFATTAPPDQIMWLTDIGTKDSGIDFTHYVEVQSEYPDSESDNSKEPSPWQQKQSQQFKIIRTNNLLSSLSRSGENWTKFPAFRNAYYDSNSIDIDGNKRTIWVLFDYSSQPELKSPYELRQTEVDCKKGSLRTVRVVTAVRDRPDYSKFIEPAPGSTERALMVGLCSIRTR